MGLLQLPTGAGSHATFLSICADIVLCTAGVARSTCTATVWITVVCLQPTLHVWHEKVTFWPVPPAVPTGCPQSTCGGIRHILCPTCTPTATCVFCCPVQTLITPHVYPPSITGATFLGNDLWEQSRTAFGYLQNPGFCGSPMLQTQAIDEVTFDAEDSADSAAGVSAVFASTAKRLRKLLQGFGISADAISGSAADAGSSVDAVKAPAPPTKPSGCTVFPVVIGETGSNFASATDRQWLADFADYIMARVSCGA